MTLRGILFCLGVTIPTVILVALLHRPLTSIEHEFTRLKYQVRGERQADSNIVIVYIDNEAIKSLGWPVRRNFYALMVKALNDLHVKAVGIDVQFEDPNIEYPEYDALLANVIASSHNVVLPSYFRSVGTVTRDSDNTVSSLAGFSFPNVRGIQRHGTDLHLPLPALRMGAAGIGHANLGEGMDIPPFIDWRSTAVPLFALELLRVYGGIDRNAVVYGNGILSLRGNGKEWNCETSPAGLVTMNLPGKISCFKVYPFLEVLKSYDALRAERRPSIPALNLKDKIVLVGIIAEGRGSVFVNTPVDPRYPAIGLHATFLDNALRSGFLRSADDWFLYLLCIAVGAVCSGAVLFLPSTINRIAAFGVVGITVVLSFGLFVTSCYLLPLAPLLIVGLVTTMSGLLYKHRLIHEQVGSLQREKEEIVSRLREKEAKLASLERELVDAASARSSDRTSQLLEDIRRYKAEILALSSKADDMEEYHVDAALMKAVSVEFEGIVYGKDGGMKHVIEFVGKIAASGAPVLILGESGTGKELVARAIHKRSGRSERQCIAVNCGALSEGLLESELFGHEKGAFTGAVKEKLGRFELADGGTIFLDEIGEVSEGFQLKLLRVLQQGEFERVGGTRTLKVNIRVLAATNKDLKEQVKARKFREDLYYRLNVLTVQLPSLRERQDDIPMLVDHFLRRDGSDLRPSKNVMEAFKNYSWPGNIRELESVITRGVLLAKADNRTMIGMKDLTGEVVAALQGKLALEDQVMASLREKGFSRSAISETADELGGLNRGTVAEYLRGECLKVFTEQGYDLEKAVKLISLSSDPDVNERVLRKLREYLANITEVIDSSLPLEGVKSSLKPKSKNLPQRYHIYLERIAEAHHKGLWKAEA